MIQIVLNILGRLVFSVAISHRLSYKRIKYYIICCHDWPILMLLNLEIETAMNACQLGYTFLYFLVFCIADNQVTSFFQIRNKSVVN